MIDKEILEGKFSDKANILCPECQKYRLSEDSKSSHNLKDVKYADEHFAVNWMGEVWESSYKLRSSLYYCDDANCKTEVLIIREIKGELNREKLLTTRVQNELYSFEEKIIFMSPSLNIIPVSANFGEDLSNLLKQSFILYWVDIDSCANKLRVFIEKLLDDLKIRKQRRVVRDGAKKIKKLSLGERIGEVKQHSTKYSQYGDSFKAIKWIGNVGSHGSETVTRERLIQAYQIIEYLLEKIYYQNEIEIKKIVKEINKKKGK